LDYSQVVKVLEANPKQELGVKKAFPSGSLGTSYRRILKLRVNEGVVYRNSSFIPP
jgi:hypothetical protein